MYGPPFAHSHKHTQIDDYQPFCLVWTVPWLENGTPKGTIDRICTVLYFSSTFFNPKARSLCILPDQDNLFLCFFVVTVIQWHRSSPVDTHILESYVYIF